MLDDNNKLPLIFMLSHFIKNSKDIFNMCKPYKIEAIADSIFDRVTLSFKILNHKLCKFCKIDKNLRKLLVSWV